MQQAPGLTTQTVAVKSNPVMVPTVQTVGQTTPSASVMATNVTVSEPAMPLVQPAVVKVCIAHNKHTFVSSWIIEVH